MRLPFPLRSNPAPYKFQGDARLINLYPEEIGAESRNPIALLPIAGQKAFSTPTDDPCRGALYVPDVGNVYSLHLSRLYKINSAGTATLIGGSIPGAAPAFMAYNDATNAQIGIVSAGNYFVLDTGTDLLKKINLDFTPKAIAFVDGYFVLTASDGKFYITGINDALSVDALDFATAEARPDNLVRGFVDRGELWLFGEETVEIWTNTGAAAFPFEPLGGSFIDRGCASAGSIASFDNAVHWVGDDDVVYRGSGYSPVRISTHAVERSIKALPDKTDIQGYAYSSGGHWFYVLTCDSWTWVFDQATQVWHERQSYGRDDWRAWPFVKAFGKNLVGDKLTGAIRELDSDTYDEASEPIRCELITPVLSAYPDRLAVDRLDIEVHPATGGDLMMQHSDDGQLWSSERQVSVGAQGNYDPLIRFNRLGRTSQQGRRFRFAMTASVARSFLLADVMARPLKS